MTARPGPARGGLAGGGAWLELAITCDPEAVEAVSEILARVAPAGVSVEPGFTLVDEGLGAAVDPTAPATVRAYLPARDAGAARSAAAEVDRSLGHLQAFGLREIGELRTQVVHESDWATAWKRHVGVLRIGHGIVIRPTWRRHHRRPGDVVIAMDPGMAFGTGLHPTTRLCLAGIERWADEGFLRGGPPGASGGPARAPRGTAGTPPGPARLLDVGCGSGVLAIAAGLLGAGALVGVDTDPIAVEATLANARRNRVARRLRAWRGSLPSGAGPFDLVAANLIASVLVALAADLAAELRPGGRLLASGIFVDREAAVREAFEGAGLRLLRREAEGDWVALEAQRAGSQPALRGPADRQEAEHQPEDPTAAQSDERGQRAERHDPEDDRQDAAAEPQDQAEEEAAERVTARDGAQDADQPEDSGPDPDHPRDRRQRVAGQPDPGAATAGAARAADAAPHLHHAHDVDRQHVPEVEDAVGAGLAVGVVEVARPDGEAVDRQLVGAGRDRGTGPRPGDAAVRVDVERVVRITRPGTRERVELLAGLPGRGCRDRARPADRRTSGRIGGTRRSSERDQHEERGPAQHQEATPTDASSHGRIPLRPAARHPRSPTAPPGRWRHRTPRAQASGTAVRHGCATIFGPLVSQ